MRLIVDARLQALQSRLGHTFAQPGLLLQALTHRSAGSPHNERLEFLGDAVLDLAVARLLFERFSGSDEGDLSRVRAHLVREDTLHRIALDLQLPQVIRLSESAARSGGASRPSILADATEALIGAAFLDAGYEAAHAVVQRLFAERIAASDTSQWAKDPKTALQEWLQSRRVAVPAYRVVAARGQAHEQTFEVACEVAALGRSATGEGRSRQAAEQQAAQRMLQALQQPGSPAAAPAPGSAPGPVPDPAPGPASASASSFPASASS